MPTIALNQHGSLASRGQRKRSTLFGPPLSKPLPASLDSPLNASNLSNCSAAVSPACIRALYQVPRPTTAVDGNEMGVYEADDIYDQADLDLFFSKYAPGIPNGTYPLLQSIDGGTAPISQDEGGGESTLDFDLVYPLIYPQKVLIIDSFSFNVK